MSQGGRGRAARPGARRERACKGCGAGLDGLHGLRVWCFACLAMKTNRACAKRSLARTRGMGAQAGRRIVDHAGRLTCGSCGAEFGATWHTRRPLLCPTCRGERIAAMNRKRARRIRAERGIPSRLSGASRARAPLRGQRAPKRASSR